MHRVRSVNFIFYILRHSISCIRRGYFETVKLLLKNKACPSLQSNSGETCIHLAAAGGHRVICKLLQDISPEEIFAQDREGKTCIDKSIQSGYKDLAQAFSLWAFQEHGKRVSLIITWPYLDFSNNRLVL
jgi:hypothetical protein